MGEGGSCNSYEWKDVELGDGVWGCKFKNCMDENEDRWVKGCGAWWWSMRLQVQEMTNF